jgi:hypothetical protein
LFNEIFPKKYQNKLKQKIDQEITLKIWNNSQRHYLCVFSSTTKNRSKIKIRSLVVIDMKLIKKLIFLLRLMLHPRQNHQRNTVNDGARMMI